MHPSRVDPSSADTGIVLELRASWSISCMCDNCDSYGSSLKQ